MNIKPPVKVDPIVSTKGLSVNFFEIILNKDSLELLGAPYSKQLLDSCIEEYPQYFFYRTQVEENNWLVAWPLESTDVKLPPKFLSISICFDEQSFVFSRIVEQSIVKLFKDSSRRIFKLKYSSTWELFLQRDRVINIEALQLQPVLAFSVHVLYSKLAQSQVLALSVQKKYGHYFTVSESQLNEQNIDTRSWTRNKNGEITASSHNRKKYLEGIGQIDSYDQYLKDALSEEKGYDCLEDYKNRFEKIKRKLFLPDGLAIEKFFFSNLPNAKFEATSIWKPRYYYYNERSKGGYYDKVVSELKPYSYDLFQNKKINILVLTPSENEGITGEYIFKLKNKLRQLFHLDKLTFDARIFDDPPTGYTRILQDIDLRVYDLAIVVMSEAYKKMSIEQSPYHRTKVKLLNQRLPSQDILAKNLRHTTRPVTNNVALNIYSKLGGTAWTVEKAEKDIPELVVGIGSTVDSFGTRIIGFANVFDHNGTYLVGDCSQFSAKDDYSKTLESYLVKVLREAIATKGLLPQQRVRLVFHLFKGAAEKYELAAIKNTIEKFSAYSIQYGIAHLSYNHNFRMYSNGGEKVPSRGTFVQISTLQGLLHLGGYGEIPLLIRLDKRSSYKDLYAATKQVLFFCHLSHRTFKPANQPVTIKYPSLMAKMLGELRQLKDWDSDILNSLSDKLWFI